MRMKTNDIYNSITIQTIETAIERACKTHLKYKEVRNYYNKRHIHKYELLDKIKNGSYIDDIKYYQLTKVNNNGKTRHIDAPLLLTLIYEHLFLELIEPIYFKRDNINGLNCKPEHGITAKTPHKSLIHRLKHLYYDRLDLNYVLVIDQRQCYQHITPQIFRKNIRRLTDDRKFIEFAINVSFVNGHLPIGTPSSPMIHHIVMLDFDRFVKSVSPYTARYADDNVLAFYTKEDANTAKWRIKNFWWYRLHIRAKRHTTKILPITQPLDFCGYVFYRNNNKHICSHNKGYVKIRQDTAKRAKLCNNNRSWASYFGIMCHADAYNLMRKIENNMKLSELTNKIKINRQMDARHLDIADLLSQTINIYDYEIRYNAQKQANWIKCLIGIEEIIDDEATGKILAYEFHGNYQGIIQFLEKCERRYRKEKFLPLEDVVIENQCGYIFRGSTNQIKYIEQ